MKAKELKKKYLEFFKKKEHAIIQSASLVPEHDPTVLFTTAGMHPLVPFLTGQPHPLGKRLTDVQKCIRTGDIDEVGDASHLTFFEMLGNWSLGDYFKKEAIEWSYEFLTKELKFDPKKLHVTVFAGDKDAPKSQKSKISNDRRNSVRVPRDTESAEVWKSLGIPEERIYFLPKSDNWWGPAGETGPCGPDTEIFIDTGKKACSPECKPGCSCGKYFEIWNDVFMEYNKVSENKYTKLKQKNVDTGMGVERTIAMLQGKDNVYEIESFAPIIDKIKQLANLKNTTEEQTISIRIIADHIRAATFILGDERGVTPSNLDQGYVLRRFIRRIIRRGKLLGIQEDICAPLAKIVIKLHKEDYPELKKKEKFIIDELLEEEDRFKKALEKGLRLAKSLFNKKISISEKKFLKLMQLKDHIEILKVLWKKKQAGKDYSIKQAGISEEEIDNATITGKEGFLLFQSYGFPAEMIIELATEKKLLFHRAEFRKELEKHQELSRKGAEQKFKGGLSEASDITAKLHTATHLLGEALRKVLKNKDIKQKGSNITPERLRYDFNFDRKLTDEELKAVEDEVNKQIKKAIDVKKQEMETDKALKSGAQAEFGAKYPSKVWVYSIGNYSKDICMGPHVKNTKELGKFKITKEESSAASVRRIKAVLE